MKKFIIGMFKLLAGICAALILIVLIGYMGVKLTQKSVPAASAPTGVKAADGRYIGWVEHRIDDQAYAGGIPLRGADGLELADLDRDGQIDIVSVHEDSNHVRIAFGTGNPEKWVSMTLAEGSSVDGVEDPAIGDIDQDGWLDLLVACEGGTIVYFQNPGGTSGLNVRDPENWKRVIPESARDRGSWIRVFVGDLNQDGRLEAVVTNKSIKMHGGFGSMEVPKSPVSWLRIPATPLDAGGWTEHQLGKYLVPVNAQPVDLDGDGDLDIVAGSRGESRMVIFRNIALNPLSFEELPLEVANRSVPEKPRLPKKLSGMVLAFSDINKDNRLDIVTFETPWSIVWLEQPADWNQPWVLHPIGAAFPDSPTALTLFDINEDGRLDLLTGGYSQDPRDHDLPDPGVLHRAGGILWFEQPDNPEDPWTRHDISRRMRGMFDAFAVMDVNDDSLMDFIGTRGNSGAFDGVFWLEQTRSDTPRQTFSQARKTDSRQLPSPPGLLHWLSDWILL